MAGLDESAARDAIVAAAREDQVPSALSRPAGLDNRWAALMLALPLAAGAALVVHMVTGRSLAAALGLALALALAAVVAAARHLSPEARADARRRARIGVLSGLVGLAAYDATRVLLVVVTGFDVKPFKALPHFGRGLLGTGVSDTTAWVAGSGYHIANGIGFAVAYCIAVRRPNWRTGIAWALLLEAAMILFYPSWLQIKALEEFVTVSLFGHLAYGATFGTVAARRLRSP
jgi:hypothetical protein